ncbi:MAG: hypothetical protein M1834_001876 [Cirrosporium novae-zelandiae]|nr:MAG: hypothetical protein M1834_001876 [Cirrosporium novae-zelandiae]
MGKNNNTKSLKEAKHISENEVVAPAEPNDDEALPTFDKDALSKLTDAISKKLDRPHTETKPISKKQSKKGSKEPKKALITGDANGPANDAVEPKNSVKPNVNSPKRGKKRDSKGEIKPLRTEIIKSKGKEGRPENGKSSEGSALEKEILALGGSKEDYDLIGELESESEIEGDSIAQTKNKSFIKDKTLGKELSNFLKDLDIPSYVPDDDPSDDGKAEDSEKNVVELAMKSESLEKPKHHTFDEEGNLHAKLVSESKKDARSALHQNLKGLLVEPRPDWYAADLPAIASPTDRVPILPSTLLDELSTYASYLLEKENSAYSSAQNASTSHQFYTTIMTSGTLSDKISALTLAVQESPIHNVKALESLVNLAGKRSRDQAINVLQALKDLLAQGSLLPPGRKLKTFATQRDLAASFKKSDYNWKSGGALPSGLTDVHLILWAYEDLLKKTYFEIVKILETWCNDEIEFARSRAINFVQELLAEKPEQEANLLRLLVNKLGDPSKKIASRTSYLLLQVQTIHPAMKPTIISAIEEQLLFKPGQSPHAKYYGILTFNQTVLSNKEASVAKQLLRIYFNLFVILLKPAEEALKVSKEPHDAKSQKDRQASRKKNSKYSGNTQDDEWREKMISAVLTGVNRAYPYLISPGDETNQHMDTLFKITHSSNFNTSIQALMLIQQLTSANQLSADRFYRTLYESLFDPRLLTSSKQTMYLNLLYRALKADLSLSRIKAFIKRITQVLSLHQPPFICGAFFLIRELENTFPGLKTFVDQEQDLDSDEEEEFHDVPDDDDEQDLQETTKQLTLKEVPRLNVYDGRKRDPEHSNADRSSLWEILPLLAHFHPTVSVSAAQLLRHEAMPGKPDLTLHTMIHFLDRFVYRNMKSSSKTTRGASIMQPLAATDSSGLLVSASTGNKGRTPVNSQWFRDLKSEDVKAEDVFFHDYFRRLGKGKESNKAKEKKTGEEKEGDSEDGEEEEIWKALVDSRPEIEADDDDDDFDMDGLDDLSDEDLEDGGLILDPQDQEVDWDVEMHDESQDDEQDSENDSVDLDDEDETAFMDDNEDLPSDVDEAIANKDESGEAAESSNQNLSSKKRRKLKHLPIFASVDDYATLLEKEGDGNDY